jgi:hypothetical protein
MSTQVHLVGSIGLDTVADVFATVGRLLGPRLKRIPDGEPGGRRAWTAWQYPLLMVNPFLQFDYGEPSPPTGPGFRRLRLAEGVRPDEVRIGELGYAREARASYQDFLRARARGDLPDAVRFQVCLPTPICVVARRCVPADLFAIEAAYEQAMLREVATIAAEIPHHDLAIQWDMTREIIWWDRRLTTQPPPFADVEREVMARIVRLSAAVPSAVELGYHLCYGDSDGRHFIEPQTTGPMVGLANAIASHVARRIAYIHMPVPIERDDDAYFAPLAGLALKPETELYLGLVHLRDGVPGTRRRMAAARKIVPHFGIATECGISRMKRPATVGDILRLHAEA